MRISDSRWTSREVRKEPIAGIKLAHPEVENLLFPPNR